MLQALRLSKSYGRIRALDTVSVTMRRGESVALIGPNGAGKTTFIKCVLGLVWPDEGELSLDGASLAGDPMLRRRIGYMPQIGRFPDRLRVGQLFELMREIRRGTHDATDEHLIEAFQVRRFAHQPFGTLSGGSRQKVSACLAFLFDPEVLVLDEPTAGLDPISVEILKEKVRAERERGKLILLTSHVLSDLDEIATAVLCLIEGRTRFHRSIAELKAESDESHLGRIVARIMRESSQDQPAPGGPAT